MLIAAVIAAVVRTASRGVRQMAMGVVAPFGN